MGREFDELFDEWSLTYDEFVLGKDEQYREVFDGYERILTEVVTRSYGTILEFGVGTGNLTEKLVKQGYNVIGVEPSKEMRNLAIQKLHDSVSIQDGDFFQFKLPKPIDTIVSTYAFHHLTDEEKAEALKHYASILPIGGKIVFADTMFLDELYFTNLKLDVKKRNYHDLLKDLETEYYPLVSTIKDLFEKNGFMVEMKQMNRYVWLIDSTKKVNI